MPRHPSLWNQPTRRGFLCGAAAAAIAASRPARMMAQSATPLTLTVLPEHAGAIMPAEFMGFSYESAQLGHPDWFSADNHALIGLFRRLGTQGVLRIGGNTEEYTTWSADDADAEKNHTPAAIGPDAGTAAKTASILTPRAIRNLRAFVDAVGWRVIYGLNLWHGSVENAVAEAKFVAETLGPKLIVFQIGNEPDMDHDAGSKERWTFDHYWEKWSAYREAVKAAVPGARFAGPDIAKEYTWLTAMAEKKPPIEFLSGHYYAEGPPADPRMTLEFLLRRGRNPATEEFAVVDAATRTIGKPYRMTEGNSCFHGGKPLVSDTLASALWGGDYLLQLAEHGYMGANLHGGGNGLYTPIAGDLTAGFHARPVYYGMLLASRFVGARFVESSLSTQTADQNVTAFAATSGAHAWKAAIFNKAAQAVSVRIAGLTHASRANVQWLTAPAIDSHEGVTLAGSSVGPAGEFSEKTQATLKFRAGHATLDLPAYTAAYVESV